VKTIRILPTAAVVAAFVFATGCALGQTTSDDPGEGAANRWAFSLAAYWYIVPDDPDSVQPTLTADRDRLHLEARYNYEDLDTASAWVGYNFSGGDTLTFEVTPMLGGVFGTTTGFAPGFELTLGYRGLELYSEGEYVFDTSDSSGSFFYSWSELTFAPVDWLRFGVVAQRTRVYQTDLDIQRGLLVGISLEHVDLTFHAFNPGGEDQTLVFAARVSW
jgi:hypothetical protein